MLLEATMELARDSRPLKLVDLPDPNPGRNDVLIRVKACGVCHTELDEIEGRTPPPALPIVPGHEVVGTVDAVGHNVTQHAVGDRVGVGWIHHSTGAGDENLSPEFRATGRDENGGYAELMTVPETYAYPIPDAFSDVHAAPLLCAGAVGFRALRLTGLTNGQTLGLTGFGGSAHIVLQIARHAFPGSRVFVFARDERQREFSLELGASWAGNTNDAPPEPLDAIIDTTPAWFPVVAALERLKPGGRLVINAIRKEDGDRDVLAGIRYEDHLWQEKELKTVANVTHHDIAEFLPLAAEIPLKPEVAVYALADANQALTELKFGPIRGAKVLEIG